MTQGKELAILVGGGPAPGINSVIGAATIRCILEDIDSASCRLVDIRTTRSRSHGAT